MATQQQKFSFPLLKPPDILQCLYELEIRMSEEELNQCDKHRESVRRVFEQLMEMCIGVTKEELAQPAFSGLQSLNYPELHEDSVSELAHFRAIHRMMAACGVHDFSVMDMLAPNHKRLKRQLSAVINFAKFREERIGLYAQLCAARDERLDTLQRTKNEAAELSARLATAKDNAAIDNAETICAWLDRFPEYKQHPFYIVGESYAGVYIPTVALQLRSASFGMCGGQLDLKGLMIGNGCTGTDAGTCSPGRYTFTMEQLYQQGMVAQTTKAAIDTLCADSMGLTEPSVLLLAKWDVREVAPSPP